jgi:hypothetical protein
MVLAVVASIGGIIWAAASNDPVGLGGRGGAFAVAVSFGLLFVRETLVEKPFLNLMKTRRLAQQVAPSKKLTDPEDAVNAIVTLLDHKSAAQTRQNVALAIVGAFATLVWGFGDWAAVPLYPYFHGGKVYQQNACCSPQQ